MRLPPTHKKLLQPTPVFLPLFAEFINSLSKKLGEEIPNVGAPRTGLSPTLRTSEAFGPNRRQTDQVRMWRLRARRVFQDAESQGKLWILFADRGARNISF